MKLYHTSTLEIQNPDIHHGRRNADFGPGFYLSPDRDFTYRWARDKAVVNSYELQLDGLNVYEFQRDQEWFDYLYHNRHGQDDLDVDVVIGPIANDTIFDTIGMISSGFLNSEQAVQLLMIGPSYTQVAIKSERAVAQLTFLSSQTVQRIDDSAHKSEQEAYQTLFAEKLQQLLETEE